MQENNHKPLDIDAIRQRLEGKQGPEYWRSLEELAEDERFEQFLAEEFPQQASPLAEAIDRRSFLKVMGAGLALAGVTGCRFLPQPKLVPYVKQPEELVPGKELFFASTMVMNGYGQGVLVKSNMGRPIKIEGNPDHPATLGSTDAYMQASILSMYDPDRSQVVMNEGLISNLADFQKALGPVLAELKAAGGNGLRIVTQTVTSPSLAAGIRALLQDYPGARWHQWQPVNRDNARAGAVAAFGRDVNTVYRFDRASVILSLDSNFLLEAPGHVRYARDFSDGRRLRAGKQEMNRLYVAESSMTITGSMADHRVALRAAQVEELAQAIASRLGVAGATGGPLTPELERFVAAAVQDLQEHRGRSVVVAGEGQTPAVHALAHSINAALGNVGQTLYYTNPIEAVPVSQAESLAELVTAMRGGQVRALIIIGGNPAYDAPGELEFAEAMIARDAQNNFLVPFRVHLSYYLDETSARCVWHLPESHWLEAWGDARAYDGTVSLIQPLIQPLYNSLSPWEFVSILRGAPANGFDTVSGYWKTAQPSANFDRNWRRALNDGIFRNSALPPVSVTPRALTPTPAAAAPVQGTLEVVFRPDPTVFDGRFANNAWLQELPKPLTKIVWDNIIAISPKMAATEPFNALGRTDPNTPGAVKDAPLIQLDVNGRKVVGPVWIVPGMPDDSVTVYLGYGRTLAGRIGTDLGFSVYGIRPAASPGFVQGARAAATGRWYELVSTQNHFRMEGRDIARLGTLEQWRQDPALGKKKDALEYYGKKSLYPEFDYSKGNRWAMIIDNNVCIACNACTVACQAENNIPSVGKGQVAMSREMHWLRIDTYFTGSMDAPKPVHMPMLCQHCEKAPCEPVCPVGATTHSHEGLNQMTYNRCIGTRYCSNNCPYKVRRFNFFKYIAGQPNNGPTNYDPPIMKLLANPDVSLRGRGVMEKCTYCVQRINRARIEAKKVDRRIREAEVVTACQAACPTRAIIFGNMNDPEHAVAELKREPQNYAVLAEYNTQPRTTYFPSVVNPNPQLGAEYVPVEKVTE